MIKQIITALGCLGFVSLIAAGCSDENGAADRDEGSISSNCRILCEKAQSCVRDELNVPECRRDCEDEATRDADHMGEVNECAACIEPRECSQAEDCFDNCIGALVTGL